VVGMKIFGAGKLIKPDEKDASLKFVFDNNLVDAITVGMLNPQEVDDTTAMAIRFLSEGVPWLMSGHTAMTQGMRPTSGSLVRCFPTGIARRVQDEQLLTESSALSGITHAHPDCLGACAVLCLAVSTLVRDPGVLVVQVLREAWMRTPWYYEGARGALDDVIRGITTEEATGVLGCLGQSLRTMALAEDFRTGILNAANCGSGSRLNAAVTGALLGARFGVSGISQDWLDRLPEFDRLVDACDTLLEIAEE